MKMNSTYSCGVDIGGTHITSVLVHKVNGSILQSSQHRSKVNAFEGPEEIIGNWANTISKSLGSVDGMVNIGIATPGPFDYEQGISYIKGQHKFDKMYGVNVKQLLSEKLGQPASTISFANDAACFLQGEVCSGCALGKKAVMGLTLGTGLGAALFTNGISRDTGLWQSAFLEGIAEDYISSRWIVKHFSAISGEPATDVKAISQLYDDNVHALNTWLAFGRNLGRFLVKHVKEAEIEMIVLGGSIAHSFSLFEKEMIKELDNGGQTIPVQISVLGEQAAMIGAVNFNSLLKTA